MRRQVIDRSWWLWLWRIRHCVLVTPKQVDSSLDHLLFLGGQRLYVDHRTLFAFLGQRIGRLKTI
jgi:hypothetical protein